VSERTCRVCGKTTAEAPITADPAPPGGTTGVIHVACLPAVRPAAPPPPRVRTSPNLAAGRKAMELRRTLLAACRAAEAVLRPDADPAPEEARAAWEQLRYAIAQAGGLEAA
jgi:hypothetical protein